MRLYIFIVLRFCSIHFEWPGWRMLSVIPRTLLHVTLMIIKITYNLL